MMGDVDISKATARPWVLKYDGDDGQHIIYLTRKAERSLSYEPQHIITYSHELFPDDGRQFEEAAANAALIVRAVNAFDGLCDALRDLMDVQNGPPLVKYEAAWNAAMAKAEAALAAATGNGGAK